jgi:hypothetical protein
MAEDLTPKIIQSYDSAQFEPGGRVREVTVIRYMLGHFGPFEHVFDRGASGQAIQNVMNDRRAQLEGRV